MARSPERFDALVLNLETRAGLAAARALGGQGYRIGIATWSAVAPGMRTRHAAARTRFPDPDEGAQPTVEAMVRWLERNPTDAILTSTDGGVTILDSHRDRFEPLAAPAIASPDALALALSKERTLEIARGLDVPMPVSILARTADQVAAAVHELGLPAVIKPLAAFRIRADGTAETVKPRFMATIADVERDTNDLVSADTPVLIQEMVLGGFEHHQFFRVDGRVVARVVLGVDRQWPPFGVSAMRETIAPPADTAAYAEALVDAMGIDGCSSVQFKRDLEGRPRLMEVNARLVQTLAVATRAGVDFSRMALEWARGREVGPVPEPVLGVRMGWLAGDLRLVLAACALIETAPRPELWDTVRGVLPDYLLGRAVIEGLDLHDPMPMVSALAQGARAMLGRRLRALRARR